MNGSSGEAVTEENIVEVRERLQGEIDQWQALRPRYAGQLLETQVVLDKADRTIERIDHPRVSFIPTLRYGKPDARLANWTLLPPAQARQLVVDLDRQQPAFAPHRTQSIHELIRDRVAAAARGLHLLDARFPAPPQADDEEPSGPRP